MAIVSSGAVSLSDIATEFGGSQPHSMSEYYSGGSNVPSGTQNASSVTIPTSGQISLASSFYGSVAEVVLLQTTITSGTRERDAKVNLYEYGYSDGTGTGGDSYGVIGTATYTQNSVTKTVKVCRTDGTSTSGNANFTLAINGSSYTGWTSITVTRGSSSGTILRTNMTSTNTSGATLFNGNIGVNGLFATNAVTTIKLVE